MITELSKNGKIELNYLMKFLETGNYKYLKGYRPIVSNKINRNDPCPCNSGLKYKKCCGR